jgi:mannose-6-phosphate isomerase-like protein (cupin superfamily)
MAPDGIQVSPMTPGGIANMSLAEGHIPPGEFSVHAHRSLEQITYVLSGRVVVVMGNPETGETDEYVCTAGDAVGTPPLVTLSFRNHGPEAARVLFICAPPYPPDDSDTLLVERHRALTSEELRGAG